MWNVPKNYDMYLRNMYGDYMAMPDPDEQEGHLVLEIRFPDETDSAPDSGGQDME